MPENENKQPFLKEAPESKPVDPRLWLIFLAIPIVYLIFDALRTEWRERFAPPPAVAVEQPRQASENCDFSSDPNLARTGAARRECLRIRQQ